MHQITIDDGNGEVIRVKVSQTEASEMIGGAILGGVMASQEIEGEKETRVALKKPVRLPTTLLRT